MLCNLRKRVRCARPRCASCGLGEQPRCGTVIDRVRTVLVYLEARRAACQIEELEFMRRSIYPLRLRPALMEEARNAAKSGGLSLNHLINVAVEEKLAALCIVNRFQERIRREGRWETVELLNRVEIKNPPMEAEKRSIGGPQAHAKAPSDSQRTENFPNAFGWANPQFGQLKKRLNRFRHR
jgi:hypothetical protein